MGVYANGNIPWVWNMQNSSESARIIETHGPDASLLGLTHLVALGMNSYAPMMFIFGLLAFLKSYFGKLQFLLEDHFTSTLHVKATDETYDMILAWTSSRRLDESARSIIARVGAKCKSQDGHSVNDKKSIHISPWNGGFWFRFKGNFFSYQIQTVSTGLHKEEIITITCLGRSIQVLRDLIEECRKEYLKQRQNKMTVFKNRGSYWKIATTKEKRPLSTVITSEAQKQELVDDVREFLGPKTQTWYAQRSIPYRRGYLLYGPPGTGKSSLASAVASEFDLDIRAVSIPSVDDQTLEELFTGLPERCVILLEDIDAVGADRSQNPDTSGNNKKTLSLSGLLNTLDGVASQDGRILFMTTNHIDKLDDALIRPGRIDKKFEIKLADANVIMDLFKFIFLRDECRATHEHIPDPSTMWDAKHVTQTKVPDTRPKSMKNRFRLISWWREPHSCQTNVLDKGTKQEKDHVAQRKVPDMAPDRVNQLAVDFAAKIPELEFSTAQIMSHLLQHKHSPEDALKHADSWVTLNSKQVTTRKVELHPDDSEPLKDVLWMKNSIRGIPDTGILNRVEKSSDLYLMAPVSPPPSPCSSASQPRSASTSVPLSAVGEMTVSVTSVPQKANTKTRPGSVFGTAVHCGESKCNPNAESGYTDIDFHLNHGVCKTTEQDGRIFGIPEQTITPTAKAAASSNIQTGIKAIRPDSPIANGCTLLPCNIGSPFAPFKPHPFEAIPPEGPELDSSDFQVGLWHTTQDVPVGSDLEMLAEDTGNIDVNSVLENNDEDNINQPEGFLDGEQSSTAKSVLASHTGDMDIDFLLDDGATKMSENERRRLRKRWEERKLASDVVTLDFVPVSDKRDCLLKTEPKVSRDAQHQVRVARNTITVTTLIEQVVTRNNGAIENNSFQTEIKAISPNNANETNTVSCLTPMFSGGNRAMSIPSKTQIGVAQLKPLLMNVNNANTMELSEPYTLFNSDRDDLLQDCTSPIVRGPENKPGSCNIGQLSINGFGTTLSKFDQNRYYGGTDVNACLPPISEFVSEHDTEETTAKDNTQPETGGSSATTVKVSSFSTPPLSAVGASVAKTSPSSAETDVQVESAVEAKMPCDNSEAEGVADICGIDVDFDLNCGARKITEKDFVRLGVHNLPWVKLSDATTRPPSISTEEFRGLESTCKDSPFLVSGANVKDGSEENVTANKTGNDISDPKLPVANADSLQSREFVPPVDCSGACGSQDSPGDEDTVPGSSPDCPPTKARDEPQTYDSPRTPDATDSGSADGFVWVRWR